MPRRSKDRVPGSKGTTEAVLDGRLVVSDACPRCGAKFSAPTGDVLTCLDCYTEFNPKDPPK